MWQGLHLSAGTSTMAVFANVVAASHQRLFGIEMPDQPWPIAKVVGVALGQRLHLAAPFQRSRRVVHRCLPEAQGEEANGTPSSSGDRKTSLGMSRTVEVMGATVMPVRKESAELRVRISNGLRLRVLRDNASLTRAAYVEFDLEAMMVGGQYAVATRDCAAHLCYTQPIRPW
jgi:hypothetical protein